MEKIKALAISISPWFRMPKSKEQKSRRASMLLDGGNGKRKLGFKYIHRLNVEPLEEVIKLI